MILAGEANVVCHNRDEDRVLAALHADEISGEIGYIRSI